MPYSNLPYTSQPTNEMTNNQRKPELISHMSHPLLDNNQIMSNPHGGHHSYSQETVTNLTNLQPNTLTTNHLNSSNELNTIDASYYTLATIGSGYNDQQTISVKKRKRDLQPNDEVNWYTDQPDAQQSQQDVKLLQAYDSNNLYTTTDLLQSNNQLPPPSQQQPQQQPKAIFNNNYTNYINPNEQWSTTGLTNHQNLPPNNYHHYAEHQQNQQIAPQLGNIVQPISTGNYINETQIYDTSLPSMSQLRGNGNVSHGPPNYLQADQNNANQFQTIDNTQTQQIHIQPQPQMNLEGDMVDDALNILKTHAYDQQPTNQITHLDHHHHVQSPTNDISDISGSMPSLSTNAVSTSNLSIHDDKVGSSNAFMRQKMNSTNTNLNNLGKGNKRSRSSRK